MSKTFEIKYDSSSKGWSPTEIRVRMLENIEDNYQPCSFTDVEFSCEPGDWLSFQPRSEGDIVCADVNVTQAFISAPPEQKFARPIAVVVKARPENASDQQQPLSVDCQVKIEEPGQKLGFTVSPDECYKEGSVYLPADAKTVCNLTVWVEEVDPESGQVYRAPEEDFELKVEMTFDPKTLLCLDINKGVIPAESQWRTGKVLADLPEPMQGEVTVKAFSKKSSSSRPVGKIDIPWALFSAEIAMEKEFTPELPAWPGQQACARLKLRQLGLDGPLDDTLVQFVWADSCKASPLGKIGILSGRTDAEGMIELFYDPPEELVYQPQQRLYDEIAILVGEGENPVRLKETVVFPVAPKIILVGTAEKKGLKLDPEQPPVEILPEAVCGSQINGNLVMPVKMEGGPLKQFGVSQARLGLGFSEDAPDTIKLETKKNGVWQLKLPEIGEAFKRAKLVEKPVKLSLEPHAKQTFNMVLDEEESQLMSAYESDITPDRLQLFTSSFQRSLKFYRYHFSRQLAEELEKNYELALSGVNLLLVAVKGTGIYLRRFGPHKDMVKSRFDKMVGTLVSIGLNALSASQKIRELPGAIGNYGRKFLEWLSKTKLGGWLARGASWFSSFAGSLGEKAINKVAPMVNYLSKAIRSFLDKLGAGGQKIYSRISGLLDDFVRVVDDLCIALRDKVANFQKYLADSVENWDDLVAWVNRKKDAAGEMIDQASGYISGFMKALEEMISTLMSLVSNLFEKLGTFMVNCLTGMFSWCAQKASTWFKPVYEWLLDHSPAVKKRVEDVLKSGDFAGEAGNDGIEACINALMAEFSNWLIGHKNLESGKDAIMLGIAKKLGIIDEQPTKAVGHVYRQAVRQGLPEDWQAEKHEFSRTVIEASHQYHDYEIATNVIDEIGDIIGIIISVGGLGVALIGVVFSGGTAIAAVTTAVAQFEAVFNLAKLAVCDIPQVVLALNLALILIIKYDLIVFDLCYADGKGTSA